MRNGLLDEILSTNENGFRLYLLMLGFRVGDRIGGQLQMS